MAKLFGHFPGKDDSFDIETILSSLRRLIVRTIEVRQKFQLKKPSEYECILEPPIPYSEFVRLVKHLKTECNPRQTVSIITFNYDVGVDFALIVGGCRPWYGFGSETRRGEHVPLLKLHGSIGWGISTTDKTIVPLNIGRIIQILNARNGFVFSTPVRSRDGGQGSVAAILGIQSGCVTGRKISSVARSRCARALHI